MVFLPGWIFARSAFSLPGEGIEAGAFFLRDGGFLQSSTNAPVVNAEDVPICAAEEQAEVNLQIDGDADEYELTPVGESVGIFQGTSGFVPLNGTQIIIATVQVPIADYDFELRIRHSSEPGLISEVETFSVSIREGPDFTIEGDSRLCPREELTLSLTGEGVTTYEWSGAAALGISDGTAEGPAADLRGTLNANTSGEGKEAMLLIKAVDELGCVQEKSRPVVIFSEPVVTATRVTACSGRLFEVDLDQLISNGVNSEYEWILDPLPAGLAKTDDTATNTGSTDKILSGSFTRTGMQSTVFTASYLVIPVSETGSCTGAPFTVAVDIPPAPSGESVVKTICSGQSTGIELSVASGSTPAGSFDVELLTRTGNIEGQAASGTELSAQSIKSDTYFNSGEAPGSLIYRITPVSEAGCRGEAFEVTVYVMPDPELRSALQIAGVDFPTSGTCGNFNVTLQLFIENAGPVALQHIQALLDLSDLAYYGTAFRGIVPDGGPAIIESDAAADPVINTDFDGNNALFEEGTGRLEPGQKLMLQWTVEVDPDAAGAPDLPKAQAVLSGLADYAGLMGDFPTPITCRAEDLSDSGADPGSDNPEAPGDDETGNDPTPLGDCHLRMQQVEGVDRLFVSTGDNCRVTVTPEMLVENYQADCDTSALPLGGYYRIFYLGEELEGPVEVSSTINGLLIFEVRLVSACEPVRVFVTPEDQTPPAIDCPADVSGLIRSPNKQNNGFDFRAAANASEAGNGEVFNRLLCTELDFIYQNDRSWRDPQYPYFTGLPEAMDDCGTARLIDMTEVLLDLSCAEASTGDGPQEAYRLERSFVYEDEYGNRDTCMQTITFFRPFIFLPDCSLELDACVYGAGRGDLTPAELGSAPFFITGAGDTTLLTESACGFSASYEDEFVQGPGQCEEKTIRTWTVTDACWSENDYQLPVGRPGAYEDCPVLLGFQGQTLVYEQELITGDITPPVVRCPGANGVQSEEVVFSAGLLSCEATVLPPPPLVEGECDTWNWTFELYGEVYDPATSTSTYELIGTAENKQLEGVPVGSYDLFYIVADACGNTTLSATPCTVVVRDAVDPVARCEEQLEVALGLTGTTRLSALEIDRGSWDNCSPVTLETRRLIDAGCLDAYVAAQTGNKSFNELRAEENTQESRTEYYDAERLLLTQEGGLYYSEWAEDLVLTCCDVSAEPQYEVAVELQVRDGGGNRDICETSVLVKDIQGSCIQLEPGEGAITGLVTMVSGKRMTSVELQLSGAQARSTLTDETGAYRFAGLTAGAAYTLQARLDERPRNGVSTLDLILTSKHILGVERLQSPYALIAADANGSGAVTTLDLIQLRKVILGLEAAFPNNTSWRFLRKDFTFTDPESPWGELEEASVVHIDPLSGILNGTDFIGVKIGDLNASAAPGPLLTAEDRIARSTFQLSANNPRLRAGETDTIDFYAPDLNGVEGFQFTLNLDPARIELEELVYGIAGAPHFGYFPGQGSITISWNVSGPERAVPSSGSPGERLFSLVLRAGPEVEIEEVIHLSSHITNAEAYRNDGDLMDIELDFGEAAPLSRGLVLYQNRPNPFPEETLIGFELPESGEAVLQIHDTGGRLLFHRRANYGQGYHEITLKRHQLTPGVLFYTLQTATQTATRRMVLVK